MRYGIEGEENCLYEITIKRNREHTILHQQSYIKNKIKGQPPATNYKVPQDNLFNTFFIAPSLGSPSSELS